MVPSSFLYHKTLLNFPSFFICFHFTLLFFLFFIFSLFFPSFLFFHHVWVCVPVVEVIGDVNRPKVRSTVLCRSGRLFGSRLADEFCRMAMKFCSMVGCGGGDDDGNFVTT